MAGQPTILFASFRAPHDPLRTSWLQFLARLQGVPIGTPPVDRPTGGIWRLLASNNRELGRSAASYESFAFAREHVHRLREAAEQLQSAVVAVEDELFGWYVQDRDGIAMTCVKWYPSAGLALTAAKSAQSALANAQVTSTVLRATNSGRRTSRVPAGVEAGEAW